MNDLTIQQQSHSSASQGHSAAAAELAKMLGLVAPITMSADQQTLWLASALDSLQGIRAEEIAAVSMEVRRSVTSYTKIVPTIAEMVAARRAEASRIARQREESEAVHCLPAPKRHIAERSDRYNFTASDWAELNEWLASQGSAVRYSPDGKKLAA